MSMKYVIVVATLITLFALATVPGHAHLSTPSPTIAQTERPTDDLDPTFGTNGQVISDLAAGTDAVDAVLLPDDRILVLGTLFYPEGSTDGEGSDFMLMRFTSDGMPDPTFGDNGMVTASAALSDTARAMIVQPDNNILVTGQDSENITLMRFTPDGTLDATFGEEGIAQTQRNSATLDRMVSQPDGKILLAGGVTLTSINPESATFVLVRFNEDGSLDSTFGENGRVVMEENDSIQDLAIQPDGKIRGAGYTPLDIEQHAITIVQHNPDGSRDTSFGEDGVLTIPTSNSTAQIHFLENNDFLVAVRAEPEGFTTGTIRDIALTKYRADGSVDPDFRSNEESRIGTAKIDQTLTMTVSSTGQTILAGTTSELDSEFDIFLVRYTPDGTIEGAITTDLGKEEFPRQVLVQSDGKFVVVGTTQDDAVRDLGESDFFLLRYLNSPFNQVYLPLTSR